MFILNQDYQIIDANTPVLTRGADGSFEFQDCYFLEFVVKSDEKTKEKINTICAPFDFSTAVQFAISKYHFCLNNERLFLLATPDTIQNNFKEPDDFLAMALCSDSNQSTVIQYFEVNYKFRHSYDPNQKYKRVGTSAAKALKKVYYPRELCGRSALHALDFWFKNGFTRMDDREQYLHYCQR